MENVDKICYKKVYESARKLERAAELLDERKAQNKKSWNLGEAFVFYDGYFSGHMEGSATMSYWNKVNAEKSEWGRLARNFFVHFVEGSTGIHVSEFLRPGGIIDPLFGEKASPVISLQAELNKQIDIYSDIWGMIDHDMEFTPAAIYLFDLAWYGAQE